MAKLNESEIRQLIRDLIIEERSATESKVGLVESLIMQGEPAEQLTLEELKRVISEQLGSMTNNDPEFQMEMSIELCKAYCRSMADAFDKASRKIEKPDGISLQLSVVGQYLESLQKEIKNLEKNSDKVRRSQR
jgi:hypothetical protein